MKARFYLTIAAALLFSAAATADSLEAKPDGSAGAFVAATLAPYGSFEFKAAPSYTHLAGVRRSAAVALRKGQITVDQAQRVQDRADEVRALLDQSLAACAQDSRTGKCTKSTAAAERLLAHANAIIK